MGKIKIPVVYAKLDEFLKRSEAEQYITALVTSLFDARANSVPVIKDLILTQGTETISAFNLNVGATYNVFMTLSEDGTILRGDECLFGDFNSVGMLNEGSKKTGIYFEGYNLKGHQYRVEIYNYGADLKINTLLYTNAYGWVNHNTAGDIVSIYKVV